MFANSRQNSKLQNLIPHKRFQLYSSVIAHYLIQKVGLTIAIVDRSPVLVCTSEKHVLLLHVCMCML